MEGENQYKSLAQYVGKNCRITWTNTDNVSDYFIVSETEEFITIRTVSGLSIRPQKIHKYHVKHISEIRTH